MIECVEPVEIPELEEIAKKYVQNIKVYFCKKLVYKGRDITRLVRGLYRFRDNVIFLTEFATPKTFIHELAHAIYCIKYPDVCKKMEYAKPEERLELRIKIEKEVDKIAQELEKVIDLHKVMEVISRFPKQSTSLEYVKLFSTQISTMARLYVNELRKLVIDHLRSIYPDPTRVYIHDGVTRVEIKYLKEPFPYLEEIIWGFVTNERGETRGDLQIVLYHPDEGRKVIYVPLVEVLQVNVNFLNNVAQVREVLHTPFNVELRMGGIEVKRIEIVFEFNAYEINIEIPSEK